MVMKGETIATGASKNCLECKNPVEIGVMCSPAGFYVGSMCNKCHIPHTRETRYFGKEIEAVLCLKRIMAGGNEDFR